MIDLKKRVDNQPMALKGAMISFFSGFFVLMIIILSSDWLLDRLININLRFVNGFLNIGLAFGYILIYNTTYYTFLTTKSIRIFLKSLTFLAAGTFEILIFIFVIYANAGLSSDAIRISILFGNINVFFMFLIYIITETKIKERTIDVKNKKYFILMPLVIFAIFSVISWITNLGVLRNDSMAAVGSISVAISFLVCIQMVFLMLLDMRTYYSTHNESYAKNVSAYVLFFLAMVFSSFSTQYGQLTYFFSRLYQVIAVSVWLKYAYRLYIGDPLKNIQQREEQVHLFAKNIETIIRKKTNEVTDINNRFLLELEYARNIQQSLLPPKKLAIKNTHFISEYFPCDKLSGDFFDIYKIDDENIGMYILDVSGHGISAALMTMFCNNYIRSTERLIMRFRGLKPHKNLAHFFEEFNKMNFPDEMHMVVFFASYNMTSKVLTYCSGGMNCIPFVVNQEGVLRELDDSEGFAICKLNGIFTPEYKSATIQLKQGERVLFYTDGLVDKEKNQVFNQQELEKLFKEAGHLSLRQLNERIVASIYPMSSSLADDITYFIMEA